MRKVFEMTDTVIDRNMEVEDGGMAVIVDDVDSSNPVGDGCVFVRLQSWDDTKAHPLMNELIGKKIRITVEVED